MCGNPSQESLLNSHIDGEQEDMTESQRDRAQLMRTAGLASDVDAPSPKLRDRTARPHFDKPEQWASAGSTAKKVPGVIYPLTVIKKPILGAFRGFTRGTLGSKNPFVHYMTLVTFCNRMINDVLIRALQQYVDIITTDSRLVDVCRYRFRKGTYGWGTVVDQFCHMLSKVEGKALIDVSEVHANYLERWSHVYCDNHQARARELEHYIHQKGIFDVSTAGLLKHTAASAENVDPAMLFVAKSIRSSRRGAPLLPPVTLGLWTSQIHEIGLAIGKKVASANLRSGLRKLISASCGSHFPSPVSCLRATDAVLNALLESKRSELANATLRDAWASQVLAEIPNCPASVVTPGSAFQQWLIVLATHRYERTPDSPMDSTLEVAMTTGDAWIRVSDLIPFFGAVGMDLTVVRTDSWTLNICLLILCCRTSTLSSSSMTTACSGP